MLNGKLVYHTKLMSQAELSAPCEIALFLAVAEGTKKECHIFDSLDLLVRCESSCACAFCEACVICIGSVFLAPANIVEWRCSCFVKSIIFLAKKADEHYDALNSCTWLIELIACVCAFEEAEQIELICSVCAVVCRRHWQCKCEAHCKNQRKGKESFCVFHIVLLLF